MFARKILLISFWVVSFFTSFHHQREFASGHFIFGQSNSVEFPNLRPAVFNLTEFGGIGDGLTLNTAVFENAIRAISEFGKHGGGQLNVPPGNWLTAPFNLTSHMTLFLAEGAVILGIDDENYWHLMPPLPSYGYGRELPGPRYGSLIHGQNLTDVVITGNNGTINGQGRAWWEKFRQKLLNHTRGPLVQIMWSSDIVISNITLRDSPFWTLHPYDCKNVSISNLTILAPLLDAPNTDGIDPDSCEDMVIENCYISVGDDAIAIKSGWDQFGISYNRPSTNIHVRNLIVRSMVSSGLSIGSEMSGGVSNIIVENLHVWSSRRGVRIKTAPGRGGYIRNIRYKNLTFDQVRIGIEIKTDYNEHPISGYDPLAIPIIEDVLYESVHGVGVQSPVMIHGRAEVPVTNLVFRDMTMGIAYEKQFSFVEGRVIDPAFAALCENLDMYEEQGRSTAG